MFPFIIILLVAQAIISLAHYAFYAAAVVMFPAVAGSPVFPFAIAFLSISFLLASFGGHRFNNILTRAFYFLAATWLGTFFYLMMAVVVYSLGFVVDPEFAASSQGILAGRTMLAIALAVGLYGVINARRTKIKSISIKIPDSLLYWKGKRAVFISDLHLGLVWGKAFLARVAKTIERIKPETVWIGGDLFDGTRLNALNTLEPFKELIAHVPSGIYFVTGNHEEFRDKNFFTGPITESGIKILDNEIVDLKGLKLAGVDYEDSERESNFDDILKDIFAKESSRTFTVLLRHTPQGIQTAVKYGINLMLSGHTHRAQVVPLNLLARRIYKRFYYGLQTERFLTTYTSSGVGTWGPPLRVGSHSEIVVITFE